MPNITSETQDDVLKVYLRDIRLSEDGLVESVGAELNTLINSIQSKKMLVNLRDVSFMNSSMIGKLVQLNSRCKNESIEFRLCEVNDNLLEVFTLMQLPKIMQIHPSEQSAFESFAD